MLALSERASLAPMALAGPAVAPVTKVSPEGIARAVAQPGGVVVVVEPERADANGLSELSKLLERGKHKPDVVVVARSFNPFAFPSLASMSIKLEKGRGKHFLQRLPEPPEDLKPVEKVAAEAVQTKKKKGGGIPAPRFSFVGREAELEALSGHLAEGGPVVVSGPAGVGKTWLVEHALAASDLKRAPDVALGFDAGHDTLVARIASIAEEAGHTALMERLTGPHSPSELLEAVKVAIADEALADRVLVVHHLEFGLGRDLDFFRKSRLELLLLALLTTPAALRTVFLSRRQPTFTREGQGEALRRLRLAGVKGKFLHEIFDSYKAIELPREKFGPISDRTHGHPMVARTFALLTRIRQDGEAIVDDPKFLAMDDLADLKPLVKQLRKRLEKLPKAVRDALAILGHVRTDVDGQFLADLKITRAERLELLAVGLLDMVGTLENKRYRVHPLVRRQLRWREIHDFATFRKLAELYGARAGKASGPAERIAFGQEVMRCCVQGRALRDRPTHPYPDHDAWLDSCIAMRKAKEPRYDLIDQRLGECLNANPANSDAWVLRLETAHRQGVKNDALVEMFDKAVKAAPVPELFQTMAGLLLARRSRNQAISVLEQGLEACSDDYNCRLRTRLASLLLRVGRRPEAIEQLQRAMETDPMLPDAYGLLGQARRDEGIDKVDEAEQLLREAVRLAPDDTVQTSRLASLLMARARVTPAKASALYDEAKELLSEVLKGVDRAPEAHLLLATLVRESAGDLDRADWLLKQARKHSDRGHDRWTRVSIERALVQMARGNLDAAENQLRQQIGKDPSNARAFAALGHVLEAKGQHIPAHAEYQRAHERAPQGSLDAAYYGLQLQRVQGVIEAQAAGLWKAAEATEGEAPLPSGHSSHAGEVVRRQASPEAEAAPAEAAPASPEAEAASAEAAPASPEAEAAPAEAAPASPEAEAAPAEAAPAEEAAGSVAADVDALLGGDDDEDSKPTEV